MTWNPNIPSERRIATTKMTPGRPVQTTHVVCHITGTNNFDSVKNEFLTSVSAHYLIDHKGVVYQFVQEDDQAWHAGIKKPVQDLYALGPDTWRKFLYYFDWDKYPADAQYIGEGLQPVQGAREATFVGRGDKSAWGQYDYFDARWGKGAQPVNYGNSHSPNAYSVGIEILSLGSKASSEAVYSEKMYESLHALIADICARRNIPMKKGHVVGHEDVNPVQRYGWDPNQGFDWTRVWS